VRRVQALVRGEPSGHQASSRGLRSSARRRGGSAVAPPRRRAFAAPSARGGPGGRAPDALARGAAFAGLPIRAPLVRELVEPATPVALQAPAQRAERAGVEPARPRAREREPSHARRVLTVRGRSGAANRRVRKETRKKSGRPLDCSTGRKILVSLGC
jgi:hypothetical protein